jgi:foldase protein PrsA
MKALSKVFVAALVIVSITGLTGCGAGDIAATVNGEHVYASEIEAELDLIRAEYPQMFQGIDGEAREIDFRQRILDNMVVNILLIQAAEAEGVTISDEDIDDAVTEVRAGFPDEASFEASLEGVGMTVEDLRDQVREQLLTQEILDMLSDDTEIDEAAIEEYYEDNQGQFTQEAAVRPAHILFGTEDKEAAERVLAEIQDGADFARLAEQYSIDPVSAEQGGELGWPSSPYVTEFLEALDELDVGEVSDLVESVFGWHIITVLEDRDESILSLEDAREEIELVLAQQAQAEAFQQFIDELRTAAEIEYFVDYTSVP